jgi:hypothetical protein
VPSTGGTSAALEDALVTARGVLKTSSSSTSPNTSPSPLLAAPKAAAAAADEAAFEVGLLSVASDIYLHGPRRSC